MLQKIKSLSLERQLFLSFSAVSAPVAYTHHRAPETPINIA